MSKTPRYPPAPKNSWVAWWSNGAKAQQQGAPPKGKGGKGKRG